MEQIRKAKNDSPSRTDLMLLGLLTERPMHGYEIAETMGRSSIGAWAQVGKTSIYYSLGRLERVGLVSRHSEKAGGKPARNVYSITDEGRQSFIESLQEALSTPTERMDSFDVALFYANHLNPETTGLRLQQRLDALEEATAEMSVALRDAVSGSNRPLVMVLEHRLAVLQAHINFLAKFLKAFEAGEGAPIGEMHGDLSQSMLHEVMLNLAAARRTGVLTVKVIECEARFVFDSGRLLGVLCDDQPDIDFVLRATMSASSGEYEFVETSQWVAGTAMIQGGLPEVILRATRDVTDESLLRRMLPDADTLLDAHKADSSEHGYDLLTSDERLLLQHADGVRTVSELAQTLKWPQSRLVTVAYPLWALGMLIRSDTEKRDLVLAMSAYSRRWLQAVNMFAGNQGVRLVEADLETMTRESGLPDFLAATANLQSVSVPSGKAALIDDARRYAEELKAVLARRLGERFVEEVGRGFMKDSSFAEGWLLSKLRIG